MDRKKMFKLYRLRRLAAGHFDFPTGRHHRIFWTLGHVETTQHSAKAQSARSFSFAAGLMFAEKPEYCARA
jgi:hypothetical protein